MEKCWRRVLGKAVGEEFGEECCREVLQKIVVGKCWRKVLGRSVLEKCWGEML